jgi:hypothetical protein
MAGLALWSFLISSAHGAVLMLVLVVLPLCLSGPSAAPAAASHTVVAATAALAVHTATMLATIATVSLVVYEWIGLAFLRLGWINIDLIWVAALAVCGGLLMRCESFLGGLSGQCRHGAAAIVGHSAAKGA